VAELLQQWNGKGPKRKLPERLGVTMALQIAATGASILTELALIGASAYEMGQRLVAAISVRVQDVFDPYRPELHYMRGPGPRWREKHGVTNAGMAISAETALAFQRSRAARKIQPVGMSALVSVVHPAATFIGHGNFRQGRAQPDL
jgi:hypothetical protein